MRARRTAVAVLLAAVAAITACSSASDTACGTAGTGPITFATVKNLTAAQRADLTGRWQRAHPSEPLDIVVLPATADEQRAQLAATLRVGERSGAGRRDGYDVVGLDVVFLAEFARSGFLQELAPRRFQNSRFLKEPWDNSTYRGRLYAVPFTTNVGLLYYWADELVRMGEIPNVQTRWQPADWQSVLKVALDSRQDDLPGPAGYTAQLAQYEGLTANTLELIWAEGGDLPTPDNPVKPAQLDRAARGVEFLLDGVRNRWIDESALGFAEQDSLNAFRDREALIMRHWPDAWPTLSRTPGLGVTRLPGKRSAVLGGESLAVARCSRYQESAQSFISFLTAPAQQKWIFDNGLYLPTLEAMYEDGSLSSGGELTPEFVALLHASVNDARGRPADPAYDRTSSLIQDAVHRAMERSTTETVDAEDVIGDLAARLR